MLSFALSILLLPVSVVCVTDFHFPFVDEMTPKITMLEFRHHLLKRPHEGDGNDNSELISSEKPKFSPTEDLLLPRPLL